MANSAVLKPMPIAREATATSVKPGLFRSHLRANRTSAMTDSSKTGDYNPPMKKLVLVVVAATALVRAQTPPPSGGFTLERVLDYPFPDNLVASPKGSTVAWTFNERGARNIYAADGPAFQARRVTSYSGDEGQELTNLSFCADGKTNVYVRGGEHGANWPADAGLQPNPNASTVQARMQVFAIATAGDASPRLLGEGDTPTISPAGDRVAFVRERHIWMAPLDG